MMVRDDELADELLSRSHNRRAAGSVAPITPQTGRQCKGAHQTYTAHTVGSLVVVRWTGFGHINVEF
jgi:hypothetical protein